MLRNKNFSGDDYCFSNDILYWSDIYMTRHVVSKTKMEFFWRKNTICWDKIYFYMSLCTCNHFGNQNDDKFLLLMLDMQYFIGWKQATVYQQLQCCFWISKVRPKKSSMYPLFLCICSFKISSYIQFHTARRETTKNSFQKKKAKEKLYLLIVFPVTFTWIRMDI